MNLRGIVSLFALAVGLCAQPSSTCPTDSTVLGNIVNTATGASENYAGYTFLTISGLNMQTGSRSASPVPPGGTLPTTMGGVTVLVNAAATYLLSFTPQQILVLLPRLQPGCLTLLVEANGTIQLQTQFYANATAPGLFTYADGQTVIASHTDWSLVTATATAHSGEWISLWAAGLGPTNPNFSQNQTPAFATELSGKADFAVLLNGTPIDGSRIGYAGMAPGFAGLYQINVLLPDNTPANPEIRLRTADNVSPAQKFLNVQ